jgi:predicted O-methyltransferase YrrM
MSANRHLVKLGRPLAWESQYVSIREYRRRLLLGALARPDSIGYWIGEQIRMRQNVRTRSNPVVPTRESAQSVLREILPGNAPVEELLLQSDAVYRPLVERVQTFYRYDGRGRSPSLIDASDAGFLYSLCRLVRPSTVVETGVSDGVSTSMILAALCANDYGRLVSIDFPLLGIPRLYKQEPGWIIPRELRERWTLFKGASNRLLPAILARWQPIDVFFHDSEHSYSCMFNEFHHAMRSIRPGGVIISDDGLVNSALLDAAQDVFRSAQSVRFTTSGLGAVRAPAPQSDSRVTEERATLNVVRTA